MGGTTALSGGVAWLPGNHRAAELGIEDSAGRGARLPAQPRPGRRRPRSSWTCSCDDAARVGRDLEDDRACAGTPSRTRTTTPSARAGSSAAARSSRARWRPTPADRAAGARGAQRARAGHLRRAGRRARRPRRGRGAPRARDRDPGAGPGRRAAGRAGPRRRRGAHARAGAATAGGAAARSWASRPTTASCRGASSSRAAGSSATRRSCAPSCAGPMTAPAGVPECDGDCLRMAMSAGRGPREHERGLVVPGAERAGRAGRRRARSTAWC